VKHDEDARQRQKAHTNGAQEEDQDIAIDLGHDAAGWVLKANRAVESQASRYQVNEGKRISPVPPYHRIQPTDASRSIVGG
jgi:hypothetical protein